MQIVEKELSHNILGFLRRLLAVPGGVSPISIC